MNNTNRWVRMYQSNALEFVVNQSIWFEGEAKFADVILPACTNFERVDISEWAGLGGYGHHVSAQQALGVAADERRGRFTSQVQDVEHGRGEGRIVAQDEREPQDRPLGLGAQLSLCATLMRRRVRPPTS